MKSQFKQWIIALASIGAVSLAHAQAAPGTGKVTFNGELYDETCEINTSDSDQTVELPKISAKSLAKAGDTAGSRMFQIQVENCPAKLTSVAAHFETTDVDAATGTARNKADTDAASNVTVQMLDQDGNTAIKLGDTGQLVPISGTGATRGAQLHYGGQYYATGAATGGKVKAIIRYTLAYS